MSNNAIEAYRSGLVPASKIAGVPASLVEEFCVPAEWHHTSKNYNVTNFYDPEIVRDFFGLGEDTTGANRFAVAALAKWKAAKKDAPRLYEDCRVEWLEWSGPRSHPRADERVEFGCTVRLKGKTATITPPNGRQFVKRLGTRGFSFDSVELIRERLAGYGFSAEQIARHPAMVKFLSETIERVG